MEIDEEILKKTTKCPYNFECLNDLKSNYKSEGSCINNVKNFVSEKLIFVNCSNSSCSYFMTFGYSVVCNCPTRMEIFIKHKV